MAIKKRNAFTLQTAPELSDTERAQSNSKYDKWCDRQKWHGKDAGRFIIAAKKEQAYIVEEAIRLRPRNLPPRLDPDTAPIGEVPGAPTGQDGAEVDPMTMRPLG